MIDHQGRRSRAAERTRSFLSGMLIFLCAFFVAASLISPARSEGSGLTVIDPWVRSVMPGHPAAGYFTLKNDTDNERVLIGAASPSCGELMLHRSINEGGIEKMVMVKSIPVPAHGSVSFAPGGYHLMCMAPSSDVTPGGSMSVTLLFEDGFKLSASFPIRNASGQ